MNTRRIGIFIFAIAAGLISGLVQATSIVGPTWDFEIQAGVITAGAQYQNAGLCDFGASVDGPVQLPFTLTNDICLGTLTQVIPTIAGQTYSITYEMDVGVGSARSPGIFAAVFDGTAHQSDAELTQVVMGNSITYPQAPANFLQNPPAGCALTNFCGFLGVLGGPNEQFETDTFTAVASGSSTTLEFVETCLACDVGVQYVEVNPVTEPSTSYLFGLSILPLGLLAFRRQIA